MFDETLLKVANALADHCRNETEAEGLRQRVWTAFAANTLGGKSKMRPRRTA